MPSPSQSLDDALKEFDSYKPVTPEDEAERWNDVRQAITQLVSDIVGADDVVTLYSREPQVSSHNKTKNIRNRLRASQRVAAKSLGIEL